jgi:cobaltochelatase CobT
MSAPESAWDNFKRATVAALRTMSGSHDVEVSFSTGASDIVGKRVLIPDPPQDLNLRGVAIVRGAADAAALRLRHHDAPLHARYLPRSTAARAAFEALEQARCEAIGAQERIGVASNLRALLDDKCRREAFDWMTERQEAMLPNALYVLAREALTGEALPPAARGLLDAWRRTIDGPLPELRGLREFIRHQDEYACEARRLLRLLALDVGPEPEPEQSDPSEDAAGDPNEQTDPAESGSELRQPSAEEGESEAGDIVMAESQEGLAGAAAENPGGARRPDLDSTAASMERYHPFTTEFDEIVEAEQLADKEELSRLCRLLDLQSKPLYGAVTRLANRLQRRLLAKQTRAWEFDLEEGILDSAQLPRIIVDPVTPLSFKQEKQTDFRDTIVTLLLDNSGSMRNQPITIAAISAQILARSLERCGVKVEILGFTTRAWKGGQSRDRWTAAGRPRDPGRLNDLRHIIYKAADAPWRRTRSNLGLMLRENLLKENIDGEALLWAHARLLARPEQRRILMVISDGAPVDDSTLSTNSANYLEKHLREVIEWIELSTPIELVAIGIRHDVTRYYRRAVCLEDAEQLGGIMLSKLSELFDAEPRTGRGRARSRRRSG